MAEGAPAAFFSYCREDSDFALRLAEDLKAAGASVWLDQLDIVPGQRWDRAVEDALANCPRMLVILSPASVNSTNVMDEVSFALEEKKMVIPVIHKDCTVPFRLRRVQYVDFRHDYARGLKELLKTLGPEQRAAPCAPASPDVPSQRQANVTAAGERERAAEEERRKTAEQTRLEEELKQATAQAQLEQERREAAQQARLEEERRRVQEQARPGQEWKLAAEHARLEEEHKRDAVEREPLARAAKRDQLAGPEANRAPEEAQAHERTEARRRQEDAAEAQQRAEAATAQSQAQARQGAEAEHRAREKAGQAGLRAEAQTTREAEEAQPNAEATRRPWWEAVRTALKAVKVQRALWIAVSVCFAAFTLWYFVLRQSQGAREGAERKQRQRELLTLRGHSAPVLGVAWSPNRERLATASGDKTAIVWDARTGKELLTLHSADVGSVAWSPDGRRLATAGAGETAKVWDADTGRELLSIARRSVLHAKPNNEYVSQPIVVSIDAQKQIHINVEPIEIDALGPKLEQIYRERAEKIIFVKTDPVLPYSEVGRVFDIANNAGVDKILLMPRSVEVAWSPDGERLATAGADKTANVWDSQTGKELLILGGASEAVTAVTWSPDGTRLATADRRGTVKVWDGRTGKELKTTSDHSVLLNTGAPLPPVLGTFVVWSPVGSRLAATGTDEWATVWDFETRVGLLLTSQRPSHPPAIVPLPPELASHAPDETRSGSERGKETFEESLGKFVWSVAWSPDGKRLATAGADKTAKVWDAETGKELLTLSGHTEPVNTLAWSPDGERLATGSDDSTVRVWNVAKEPGP